MIDAPDPVQVRQEHQMAEPTTVEMLGIIEDLQGTVADLTFGVLIPSKSSTILGQVVVEKGQPETISSLDDDRSTTNGPHFNIATQSLGQAEASYKNKAGTSIDPYAHLWWAIETLKVKGLNKQQVLAVVAKTMDDTFVVQVESILNQRVSRKKGCFTRNTHPDSSPKPMNTQPTPANLFANISKTNASSSQK